MYYVCLTVIAVLVLIAIMWAVPHFNFSRRASLYSGFILIFLGNTLALFFAIEAGKDHFYPQIIEYGRQGFYILATVGASLLGGAIARDKSD